MRHLFSSFLFAATATSQAVLPPFNNDYRIDDLGTMVGVGSYGGTAFVPGNPNILLVAAFYGSSLFAVPLNRDLSGHVVGTGPATLVSNAIGFDGGLAFGSGNVLFATWYGVNRLAQFLPGSTVPDRSDDLGPLGVAQSVGACTFVPAGLPGAGRLKVGAYSGDTVHDLPLTPDGSGTFAPGTAGTGVYVGGGVEGLVYVPAGAPQIGGQLLVVGWSSGDVVAYQCDAIGDPIAATGQTVVGGLYGAGGGVVDPLTGDILFNGAVGRLFALRQGAACGTVTAYGVATPGAAGTPTIAVNGCSRIGQTIAVQCTGPAFGIGLIAAGVYPVQYVVDGLTVLQSLDSTVVQLLDAGGNSTLPLGIPAVATLGHAHLYLQCAFLDASNPSGLTASAAVDLEIR